MTASTHTQNVRAAEAEVVKAAEAVFATYETKSVGVPEMRLHDAVLQLRAVRDEPV